MSRWRNGVGNTVCLHDDFIWKKTGHRLSTPKGTVFVVARDPCGRRCRRWSIPRMSSGCTRSECRIPDMSTNGGTECPGSAKGLTFLDHCLQSGGGRCSLATVGCGGESNKLCSANMPFAP